ncbi:MAG: hypothetical protein U1A27_10315 [Phycisphaerae bacterium]
MSTSAATLATEPLVLIVSDADDPLLREYRDGLSAAGVSVGVESDVYQTVLRLASDARRSVRMVLFDTRAADHAEQRFFGVVRHYFPWIMAGAIGAVPAGDGERPAGAGPMSAADAVSRARQILDSLGILRPETDGARGDDRIGGAAESADRSNADAGGGSMHETVRARMASDLGRTVVRRGPPRSEPAAPPRAASDDVEVTPVEIEALLRGDEPGAAGAAEPGAEP